MKRDEWQWLQALDQLRGSTVGAAIQVVRRRRPGSSIAPLFAKAARDMDALLFHRPTA